jgi:hypothetical protein
MAHLILPTDSTLNEQIRKLAHEQRLVFFAGLPGTGKSLLVHQLAHLAATFGRTVHLLQWDTARPVFEANPAAQRYPLFNGITHAVIRKAVGLWARHALVEWHQRYSQPAHLLIGETPFIGNRFIELARTQEDKTEGLLRDRSCWFLIPVPSRRVRSFIVSDRQRRNTNPLHAQEREDAPPQVLRALWQELWDIAPLIGASSSTHPTDVSYDPALYQRVYQLLLKHRNTKAIQMDTLLATTTLSVYDFARPPLYVQPNSDEVIRFIGEVEKRYPDRGTLQREIDQWYLV